MVCGTNLPPKRAFATENRDSPFSMSKISAPHTRDISTSREKRCNNTKTTTDPHQIPVQPCHPDTELFRYTNAYYRDLHLKVDGEIAAFLEQLETDGLMEDTIIFYYGDHGGVLPGSKGYINERGLQVPMVVYVPEKWQHLLPVEVGSRVDGFVQFIDLGPTVLNLAGVEIPAQVDGRPFLGKGVTRVELNSRDITFSYADRFDEKSDFVRAVRKGNLKYHRNYLPLQP